MNKNILLPTDFSDNAWSAAVYAMNLHANEECTFYFLNSSEVKASRMSNLSNKLTQVMTENSRKELAELKDMAETANANSNHSFEIIVSYRDLYSAILDTVKKYKIDLLVMGTKGATKAEEIFFGSNTVNVMKKMRLCPVLIIPDEFDFVRPEQIAFPTGFNRFYDKEILPIKQLSDLYNSKIRIVHLSEEHSLTDAQNFNLARLKSALEDYPHSFHWIPNYAKKTQEINDFIRDLNIDILVMINYKHSIIQDITHEPIIKKVGFQPLIPFLVIPE